MAEGRSVHPMEYTKRCVELCLLAYMRHSASMNKHYIKAVWISTVAEPDDKTPSY